MILANKNAADVSRPRVKWRLCCRGVLPGWLTATPLSMLLSRRRSPPAGRGRQWHESACAQQMRYLALGVRHSLCCGCSSRREALDRRWYTGLSLILREGARVRTAVLVSALALLFAPFLSACAFSMYPGAKRVSDARHTGRAIAYATPDAYEKVIEYYKKDCKVVEYVPGAAEVHFDGGQSILIRDMKQDGTTIVVPRQKKK